MAAAPIANSMPLFPLPAVVSAPSAVKTTADMSIAAPCPLYFRLRRWKAPPMWQLQIPLRTISPPSFPRHSLSPPSYLPLRRWKAPPMWQLQIPRHIFTPPTGSAAVAVGVAALTAALSFRAIRLKPMNTLLKGRHCRPYYHVEDGMVVILPEERAFNTSPMTTSIQRLQLALYVLVVIGCAMSRGCDGPTAWTWGVFAVIFVALVLACRLGSRSAKNVETAQADYRSKGFTADMRKNAQYDIEIKLPKSTKYQSAEALKKQIDHYTVAKWFETWHGLDPMHPRSQDPEGAYGTRRDGVDEIVAPKYGAYLGSCVAGKIFFMGIAMWIVLLITTVIAYFVGWWGGVT